MDHPDIAGHVGQQHRGHVAALVVVNIAQRSGDAGIVDQHVETSLFLLDDAGGAPGRVVGRDVELDEASARCLRGSATALRVTSGQVHAVPGAGKSAYRLQADALVSAGDQAHRHATEQCRHRSMPFA